MPLAFGRKQTAQDAANARERPRSDPRALGLSLAMGLGLALGALALLQWIGLSRDAAAREVLEQQQAEVAATIAERARTVLDRVRTAVDDDELRNALTTVDAAGRARARLRLRERLPEVVGAEVYPPALDEVLTGDLAAFGYARANALFEARAANADSPLYAQNTEDGWRLAIAVSVKAGDRAVGYAYLLLPADDVLAAVSEAPITGGVLDLRQGPASVERRVAGQTTGGEDAGVAIAGTGMRLVASAPETFKVGDFVPLVAIGSSGLALALAVFGFVLAGGAFATRAMMARRAAADLKERPAVAPERRRATVDDVRRKVEEQPAVEVEEPVAVDEVPEPGPASSASRVSAAALERSIFRAYDIRGQVGSTLTPEIAQLIGQSIGSAARERGLREIAVGRDGRLSGPDLAGALIQGLCRAGCDVVDIGAVPTPVLYFATFHLNIGSGVSVTGSHNPPDYNGFKIMLGGETLAEEAIQDLFARIVEGRLAEGEGGVQQIDVREAYVDRITSDIQLERRLKIVVDAGNGIAGNVAPQVLEGIGCEVVPLYCEVDGRFPNHHPDPSEPANLKDLIVTVKQMKADLGLAFDGDGDRLGVVTANGEIVFPDRLLMLFAIDVLTRAPGAPIIYDVKCTGHLQDLILRHGGSPIMWKTGHSLIKAKMREEDAELAGEMSGHFFFRERWFGFDDGIYAAARLCEILGSSERSPQELFDELPKGVATPELKVPMAEGQQYAFVARFRERAAFPGARLTTIDGVRADYADGWGLVRCSNTTPTLVLRFDADNRLALNRIQEAFREQLLAVDPGLKLPF